MPLYVNVCPILPRFPLLSRLPFHAIIFGFPIRVTLHSFSMPADSTLTTTSRMQSDFGKVFPSGVRIDKTAYGFGVFAFAFIPQGTSIARVSGDIIHDPLYSSDYCIDAGDGKVLEPAPPFCYLNHSCEPNCELMVYDEGGPEESEPNDNDCIYGGDEGCAPDGRIEEVDDEEPESTAEPAVWVEAIRDIMPNEELTIDYSWPADRAAPCLCGKPQCRGWIVDPTERDLLPS